MEVFVPGRLCILGEHTDWAAQYRQQCSTQLEKGFAIVCTTNEGLYSRCESLDSNLFQFSSIREDTTLNHCWDISNDQELLVTAMSDSYLRYVAGTAWIVLQNHSDVIKARGHGLQVHNYKTTLPIGRGLSSSAAICITIAESFNRVYNLGLTTDDIMELAYLGEIKSGSQCGRLDQCCALGRDAIALVEFDVNGCAIKRLENKATLYFVVADLCAGKDTVAILRDLNACFPDPCNDTKRLMHEYVNLNAEICRTAVTAIERGDVRQVADCMRTAQLSFDKCAMPNCPSELTSPRLHKVMADEELNRLCLASKGVGSQGDGSIQVLCESSTHQQRVLEVLKRLRCEGFLLTVQGARGG